MARWIIIALLFFPNIALGGVYVSGGVDPVEIGRRIAVSSPGVITLASGSVTLSNTKISAVDGTAFVDFSTANVLTDYVANRAKLTITDSAGKKLIGYIKAAGTGETYGAETHNFNNAAADPNGTETNAATGWTTNGTSVTAISSDKTTGSYALRCAFGASGKLLYSNGAFVSEVGALYKLIFDLKKIGSPFFCWVDGTGTSMGSFSATTSWTTYTKYLVNRSGTGPYVGLYGSSVTSADEALIDNYSRKKVLTPSATGVTITSTADGTTYNWESQESGFNYNDASGYTYAITSR